MDMTQRPTLMKYRNYRYLKTSCMLVAIAIAAYAFIEPAGGIYYGGTWLGYTLGVISALLILLQMWYGISKRHATGMRNRRQQPASSWHKQDGGIDRTDFSARHKVERRKRHAKDSWRYGGSLQGWLSAHVYLGTSLIVLASLHTGFQFGWNVHTLTYVLMLLVIASGFYGVFAYLNYPSLITRNMGEDTLNRVLIKIAELDELARIRALYLPDEVNALVLKSRQETRLGGNLLQQLSGSQRDCPTRLAVQKIQLLGEILIKDEQPKLMRDLYSVLLRKQKLVSRARNEIMLQARMQFWLYLHAPLSIALLAGLLAHIAAIFFYW